MRSRSGQLRHSVQRFNAAIAPSQHSLGGKTKGATLARVLRLPERASGLMRPETGHSDGGCWDSERQKCGSLDGPVWGQLEPHTAGTPIALTNINN